MEKSIEKPVEATNQIETFPRFEKDMVQSGDLCIVLHGYGIDPPTLTKWVDDYRFVGGVGRNIPRRIANAWRDGTRWQDNKPAMSRIYPQAILPNNATEVDIARAAGVKPMEPSKVAAMISAIDAQSLVDALGRQGAVKLAEQLIAHVK